MVPQESRMQTLTPCTALLSWKAALPAPLLSPACRGQQKNPHFATNQQNDGRYTSVSPSAKQGDVCRGRPFLC